MLKAYYHLLLRDLRLSLRSRHELANPLIFFVLVVTLFPLAVTPTPDALQTMAPGVIWVSALHCEAKPVIDYYRLKKSHDDNAFDLYRGDDMLCIISGVGKIASAAACAWIASGLFTVKWNFKLPPLVFILSMIFTLGAGTTLSWQNSWIMSPIYSRSIC